MGGASKASPPSPSPSVLIWLNIKGYILTVGWYRSHNLKQNTFRKLNPLLTVHNEWAITQRSPQFISAVRTDLHSSAFKRKTLVKSFSSAFRNLFRSSVGYGPCIQQYLKTTRSLSSSLYVLIMVGLWDSRPGWNHCHLCEIRLNATGLLCSLDMLIDDNSSSYWLHQRMKVRWSYPQQ